MRSSLTKEACVASILLSVDTARLAPHLKVTLAALAEVLPVVVGMRPDLGLSRRSRLPVGTAAAGYMLTAANVRLQSTCRPFRRNQTLLSVLSPSVPHGGLVTFVVTKIGVLENDDLQTFVSLGLLEHEIEIVK